MTYKLHLNKEPFVAMKNGGKTIELRVNDEKDASLKLKTP